MQLVIDYSERGNPIAMPLDATPKTETRLRLVEVDADLTVPVCFRSDDRYQCKKNHCPSRKECVRLVAAWLR